MNQQKRKMENKLHLGCGKDYKKGYVNVDFNKEINADKYFDLEEFPYPLKENTFNSILTDNVLEHIKPYNLIKVMEELYRICKPNAIIEIYVPHQSGMYAFKHLTHYTAFGVGKFNCLEEDAIFSGERYSNVKFKVLNQRLLFFHHNLQNNKWISKIPINWIFNFSPFWKELMERFQFFGFDEIYYKLGVIKKSENTTNTYKQPNQNQLNNNGGKK